MEKKIELQVINISNSQAQVGAFAMLLGEVNGGDRHLPILIGPAEAQATALYLKGVATPRPLTHDLFIQSLSAVGASLARILIYKAKEGVFYTYIYLQKGEETTRLDARTSDAVALAVRADCPILIYDSILEQECVRLSEEARRRYDTIDQESEEKGEKPYEPYQNSTFTTLEQALGKAIKEEDYERAARIRDRINSRNKKK